MVTAYMMCIPTIGGLVVVPSDFLLSIPVILFDSPALLWHMRTAVAHPRPLRTELNQPVFVACFSSFGHSTATLP